MQDTLNSTMDTVLSLLKEVEHREKIAEEAVDKANRTSSYILAMMEEIKQAKQRTKEANEKVYFLCLLLLNPITNMQCALFKLIMPTF